MKKQPISKKPLANAKPQNTNKGIPYEDFMTLFFISAVLIIDFFPYFGAYEIIAPQFLYLTILNVVIVGYVYGNTALHSRALLNIFKSSLIFKLYIAFIGFCFVSMLFAKNLSLSILNTAEILVIFSMFLNFSILLYGRLHLIGKICFLIAVSALFQSGKVLYEFRNAEELKGLYYAFGSDAMKGNTGNMNIMAASIMLKLPFILFGIRDFVNWKRWLASISICLCVSVILMVSARAALLSLLLVMVLIIIFYLKDGFNKKSVLILLFVFIPICISYYTVNELLEKLNLNERFTSTTSRLAAIGAQDKSSGRRLKIWNSAIGLIKEHPITGVGIGNFRVESVPYDLSTNETIPLHAHNDFLEIASETGLLNAAIYISIFLLLAGINIKRFFGRGDKKTKDIALIVLLLLVVYGIDVLVNFPMLRPTMAIGFCFIMALTFVNINVADDLKNPRINFNRFVFIGLALAFLPLYPAYSAFQASNLEREIQADDINMKDSGKLKGADVLKRLPTIPNVFNTSESFVEYAGIYFLREKNFEQAIKLFDEGNKINPYLGRPDFCKSIAAEQSGKLDSAYYYNKLAFYRRPVNNTFYNRGLLYASVRKDTAEMVKMYNMFTAHIKNARVWEMAYTTLERTGYSESNLAKFAALGVKTFPNDTVVSSVLNAKKITNIIVEAQSLTDQGKLEQALANYKKGLSLEPNNIYINQNLGFHYFNSLDYKTAAKYFLKSLAKPGLNGGRTEFYLSLSFFNIGDLQNGCKWVKVSKEKGYGDAAILADQYKCN